MKKIFKNSIIASIFAIGALSFIGTANSQALSGAFYRACHYGSLRSPDGNKIYQGMPAVYGFDFQKTPSLTKNNLLKFFGNANTPEIIDLLNGLDNAVVFKGETISERLTNVEFMAIPMDNNKVQVCQFSNFFGKSVDNNNAITPSNEGITSELTQYSSSELEKGVVEAFIKRKKDEQNEVTADQILSWHTSSDLTEETIFKFDKTEKIAGVELYPKLKKQIGLDFIENTKNEPVNTDTFNVSIKVKNLDEEIEIINKKYTGSLLVYPSKDGKCVDENGISLVNNKDVKTQKFESEKEITLNTDDYLNEYVCAFAEKNSEKFKDVFIKSEFPIIKEFDVIFASTKNENLQESKVKSNSIITETPKLDTNICPVFVGWYEKDDAEQKIVDFTNLKITKNTTFVPKCTQPQKEEEPKQTTSSGGGGGGYTPTNSSTNTTVVSNTSNTTIPTIIPTKELTTEVKGDEIIRERKPIFTNLNLKCEQKVKNLTDSRLTQYYTDLNVINQENLNRDLTRAEFLKLIINSANIDVSNETIVTNFVDVDSNHTLAKYISYAVNNGLVSGQNNSFRPNDTISRAEAAKIFTNAAGLNISTNIHTFSYVSIDNSLAKYIQTTYDNCLLNGRKTWDGETLLTDGRRVYEPESAITLAETAKVLYNMTH